MGFKRGSKVDYWSNVAMLQRLKRNTPVRNGNEHERALKNVNMIIEKWGTYS